MVYVLYTIVVSGFDRILAQYFFICIFTLDYIGTRPCIAFKFVLFLTYWTFLQHFV